MPKKETDRKADVFAGMGSLASRLKARREALEAGEPEKAASAFNNATTATESTLRRREDAERFPTEDEEKKKY